MCMVCSDVSIFLTHRGDILHNLIHLTTRVLCVGDVHRFHGHFRVFDEWDIRCIHIPWSANSLHPTGLLPHGTNITKFATHLLYHTYKNNKIKKSHYFR